MLRMSLSLRRRSSGLTRNVMYHFSESVTVLQMQHCLHQSLTLTCHMHASSHAWVFLTLTKRHFKWHIVWEQTCR